MWRPSGDQVGFSFRALLSVSLDDLLGPEVQDVDVEDVVHPGDEDDPVPVRRPGGRVVVVPPEADLADVRALGVQM